MVALLASGVYQISVNISQHNEIWIDECWVKVTRKLYIIYSLITVSGTWLPHKVTRHIDLKVTPGRYKIDGTYGSYSLNTAQT